MALAFAPGVAQKIRDAIRDWPHDVGREIWEHLEELDEDPSLGKRDEEGIFGGARFYQFRVIRLPLVLRATVAFAVRRKNAGHVVEILDFAPRFVEKE